MFTGSHHRQKGSDFSSSSDEEYQMSPSNSKAKRSLYHSASVKSARGHKASTCRSKSVSLETEEDEDQDDGDPYQNWSTHSAEIAK